MVSYIITILTKAKIDHHGKVGEMVTRAAEAKAANHNPKALITPLVEGKGEPEALTRRRVDPQDPTSPQHPSPTGESHQRIIQLTNDKLSTQRNNPLRSMAPAGPRNVATGEAKRNP